MNLFLQIHFGIIALGIVLISLYSVNLKKLFNYLKDNYPEKYQELGKPSFVSMSMLKAYRLLKFLEQFFQNSDAILQKTVKKVRIFLISGNILVLAGIISFIIFNFWLLPRTTVTRYAKSENNSKETFNIIQFFQIPLLLFALVAVIFFFYSRNLKKLFNYLKSNYPEVHKDLDEPGLTNMSLLNSYKVLSFLKQPFRNSDAVLQKNIKKVRILFILFLTMQVTLVLSILFSFIYIR